MESSKRSLTALGAVVAGVLAGASSARAADVSYGAYAGLGYSDNITRSTNGELEDTIALLGGQVRIDHESRRLTADVAARMEYRDYLDDTYDSEMVGSLVGNALLNIIEDRFTWTLEDTFGQATQNQFSPATPDNRENVNFLTTGPDFTLPLGTRNRMIVHGRYIDVHYEDSGLGNTRTRGEAVLMRDLSEASNVSINANSEQVEFDDDQFNDYDRREAFLNYSVNSARTTLSIDGGVTEISAGDQTEDGWLGRLELTRQVSTALRIGLELGHDFSDAGSAFAQMQELQPGLLDPVSAQQTANPFENTYGAVFGNFSRNRTDFRVRAGYYDEQYEAIPQFDRTRLTVDTGVSRHLNAALSAVASANFSRQEYDSLDLDFSDFAATLGLRWSLGRATQLSADYRYLRRSDNTFGDYRANELWLRVSYTVGEDVSSRASGDM